MSTLLLLNRVASAIHESALAILTEQKKGMNRQAMYMYTGTCICTCSVLLHLNFKLLCYCTKKLPQSSMPGYCDAVSIEHFFSILLMSIDM